VTFRVSVDAAFPSDRTEISNQARVASAELPEAVSDDPTTPEAGDATRTPIFLTPSVTLDGATVAESAGSAQVPVRLSFASNREVRVEYATSDGTATAGADFTAGAGTVIFAPGETAKTIAVPILDDSLDELDETFTVTLANPVHATLSGSQAVVTITDDDAAPVVSASSASVGEGGGTASVSVTLSAPSGLEVRVDYATADGTATAGSDYTAQSGTLIFPAGKTSQTVSVPITNDVLDEEDETFEVRLSNAVNATLGSSGTVTIVDDDESRLSINDTRVAEGDQGTTDAIFAVRLSNPSSREVRVDYATVAGTAKEGVDYQAVSGTLTFASGETEKTVKVPVTGDRLLEADETFHVQLSNALGAGLDSGGGLGTIVDDELCAGPNLLLNPGAEQAPAGAGTVPGWRAVAGSQWQPRGGANPQPAEGSAYFYAGQVAHAELAQDVDVSAYARSVDNGAQTFAFSGAVRTLSEQPSDIARIVVEYRDAANVVVLGAFDTGEIASPLEWRAVADSRPAPVGARWIRVRLIADRFQGSSNDGYFDALSLRSQRIPVLAIGDAPVYEGTSGTQDALFGVTLSCPVDGDVSVGYATADGTAVAGSDYQPVSGTLTFLAGTTQQTVAVPVIGDQVSEPPSETFKVNLSGAQPADGVAITDPQGIGTILDDDNCARSPGYWKNHTSAWPVQSLVMGGRTYNASQMLTFLLYGGSDASLHLARQLVATRLNLASGSSPSILPVADAADSFLATVPPGSNPQGTAADQAEALKNQLEQYNADQCGS
jgi:chitinase